MSNASMYVLYIARVKCFICATFADAAGTVVKKLEEYRLHTFGEIIMVENGRLNVTGLFMKWWTGMICWGVVVPASPQSIMRL